MQIEVTSLVSQTTMIRLKAEALAAEARVLEQTLKDALTAAAAQRVAPSVVKSDTPCACPPNRRVSAITVEHPTRTQCSLCKKEHD